MCDTSSTPANATAITGYVTITWDNGDWNIPECEWECNTGYHTEDNATCTGNTKLWECKQSWKPSNSQYNVTQTWRTWQWTWDNGDWNIPECEWRCDCGYYKNVNACTQCGAKEYSNTWANSCITAQTWYYASWSCSQTGCTNKPVDHSQYTSNGSNNDCSWECETDYHEESGVCTGNTRQADCDESTIPNWWRWVNKKFTQTRQNGWWTPQSTGWTYHTWNNANSLECSYRCDSSHHYENGVCTGNNQTLSCDGFIPGCCERKQWHGTYIKIWNWSSWNPSSKSWAYDASECGYFDNHNLRCYKYWDTCVDFWQTTCDYDNLSCESPTVVADFSTGSTEYTWNCKLNRDTVDTCSKCIYEGPDNNGNCCAEGEILNNGVCVQTVTIPCCTSIPEHGVPLYVDEDYMSVDEDDSDWSAPLCSPLVDNGDGGYEIGEAEDGCWYEGLYWNHTNWCGLSRYCCMDDIWAWMFQISCGSFIESFCGNQPVNGTEIDKFYCENGYHLDGCDCVLDDNLHCWPEFNADDAIFDWKNDNCCDKCEDINSEYYGKYNCSMVNAQNCPQMQPWGGWWGWCFLAGTQIHMLDGSTKNIEDIEEWDIVLSYNTQTKHNEYNKVLEKYVHENNREELYELTIDGNVLEVTAAHRFYVVDDGYQCIEDWISASKLKVWYKLMMKDGQYVTIDEITHHSHFGTVYNLNVENVHNYYVDEGYLVHNEKEERTDWDPSVEDWCYDDYSLAAMVCINPTESWRGALRVYCCIVNP